MNQISKKTKVTGIEPGQMTMAGSDSSTGELVVKGVTTALAAATIIETGKGVFTKLAKHPLIMFSMGIAAGFFVQKYRKEIISITSKTAEQSKDYVWRQKELLKDLLEETRDTIIEEKDVSE
jgi:hypothetical protein